MTVKLNDLVEIQRSHITLGNYYMNFNEDIEKRKFNSQKKIHQYSIQKFFLKFAS